MNEEVHAGSRLHRRAIFWARRAARFHASCRPTSCNRRSYTNTTLPTQDVAIVGLIFAMTDFALAGRGEPSGARGRFTGGDAPSPTSWLFDTKARFRPAFCARFAVAATPLGAAFAGTWGTELPVAAAVAPVTLCMAPTGAAFAIAAFARPALAGAALPGRAFADTGAAFAGTELEGDPFDVTPFPAGAALNGTPLPGVLPVGLGKESWADSSPASRRRLLSLL
mmetsp:Transcript_18701/g.60969  ORF Transcript_18701/g.60969 Transcript_18701/m.60969 type:complete len:224 (+) Transcript_18701:159-830(+)